MKDKDKTKEQLISELEEMRQRIAELDALTAERKQVGKALQKSEKRYRLLTDNAADVIWTVGLDMRPTYMSPSITRLLGYSVEEAMVKTMKEVFTPASFDVAMKAFAEELSIEKMEQQDLSRSRVMEFEFKRKDGSIVPVEISYSFLRGADAQPVEILAVARDITECKRVEDALRKVEQEKTAILDSMSEVVVFQDMEHRLIWANRVAGESVNLAPKQLVGHYCYEIWHQRSEPCVGCPVAEARETGQPQASEMTTPDGRVWSVRGYPVRDANGDITGIVESTLEITERKKAEEALRQSEEKLRLMFESATDGIVVTDLNGNIMEVNEAAVRLHGSDSKEKLIGQNTFELIAEKDRVRVMEILKNALEDGQIRKNVEITFLTEDGREYFAEVSSALLKDAAGNSAGFIAIFRDITERKQAEETLRESEEKLRTIIENTRDVIFRLSPLGVIQYVSPQVKDLYGYEPEDLIGKHLKKTTPLGELPRALEAMKTVLSGKVITNFEINQLDSNGRIVPIEINGTPVRRGGKIIAVQGCMRDITERKQAEEQTKQLQEYLQLQIDRMPIGLIVWDTGFHVQSWNPAAEKIFGFSAQEALGKHPYDFIVPKDAQAHVDDIWHRLLEGDMTAQSVNENTAKDGQTILCDWLNTPLRRPNGRVIGVLSMVQDITKREQIEKTVRELYEKEKSQRKELEEAAKARGLFINALAHELRTPLTPILASVGVLKENLSSSPETDEFKLASNILKGTELLTSRLEEFLIFAKFTSGAFSLKTQLIDTREFIKGVALQLMSAGDEGEQRFILELPQNLPKIEADPSYLQQVVTILLSNATKFSSKEESITLRAKAESGELVVEVEGKGAGMSAEEQQRILQPYHRVEQDRQRFPGLGLGIAVSKRIIEAHGGKMWLSSKLGKGTTFSFSLPLRSEERKPRH